MTGDTEQVWAPEDGRLDAVVASAVPEISRSQATRLVKEGHVTVLGTTVTKPSFKVLSGTRLSVTVPPPASSETVPQDLPLDIVYQDTDVAVVHKPAGMVVHPAPGHPDGTLVNALLHHLGDLSGVGGIERPGIVHRLDRGTSGLLVVAKNDVAHRALQAQFKDRTAGRVYLAVALAQPREDSGTVRKNVGRHPTDRLRFHAFKKGGDQGKRAITHWQVVGRGKHDLALVRCKLETGRTHQIRVHLTSIGHPLVGDDLYQRRDRRTPRAVEDLVEEGRTMLHAWQLTFQHPADGAPRTFVAAPPSDFLALCERAELEIPEP